MELPDAMELLFVCDSVTAKAARPPGRVLPFGDNAGIEDPAATTEVAQTPAKASGSSDCLTTR